MILKSIRNKCRGGYGNLSGKWFLPEKMILEKLGVMDEFRITVRKVKKREKIRGAENKPLFPFSL